MLSCAAASAMAMSQPRAMPVMTWLGFWCLRTAMARAMRRLSARVLYPPSLLGRWPVATRSFSWVCFMFYQSFHRFSCAPVFGALLLLGVARFFVSGCWVDAFFCDGSLVGLVFFVGGFVADGDDVDAGEFVHVGVLSGSLIVSG